MKRFDLEVEQLIIKHKRALVITKHIHVYADSLDEAKKIAIKKGYRVQENDTK